MAVTLAIQNMVFIGFHPVLNVLRIIAQKRSCFVEEKVANRLKYILFVIRIYFIRISRLKFAKF